MSDNSKNRRLGPPPHSDRWHKDGEAVSLVRKARTPILANLAAVPQDLQVDLASCALVIVDMQNDFLDAEGWFSGVRGVDVSPLHAPISTINALAAAFREADVPVIHMNWGVREDAADLPANVLDKAGSCGGCATYGEEGPHGSILAKGSWGAASHPTITIEPTDLHVAKTRLSGFRDNEFDQILRRRGITTLMFVGVNIDRCVFATLMDASFEGYDCILVTDACATVSPEFVSEAILYLTRLLYGFTTTAAEVLAAFKYSNQPQNGDEA